MKKTMIALALPLLAACGSVTGPTAYPEAWPPPTPGVIAERCPDLNGVYANVASAAHPALEGGPPTLTAVFGRMERSQAITASGIPWNVPTEAERVELALDEEQLTVTFHRAADAPLSLRFRRHHLDLSERRFDDLFTCYRDADTARLRFMQDVDPRIAMLRGVYLGANVGLVFLLKAADGSLVVQFRTEDIGLSAVLIGSHATFDSLWWRYPPAARVQ
jgi:hypothetical protein